MLGSRFGAKPVCRLLSPAVLDALLERGHAILDIRRRGGRNMGFARYLCTGSPKLAKLAKKVITDDWPRILQHPVQCTCIILTFIMFLFRHSLFLALSALPPPPVMDTGIAWLAFSISMTDRFPHNVRQPCCILRIREAWTVYSSA